MRAQELLGAPALALLGVLALVAAVAGGACGGGGPSDQGQGGMATTSTGSTSLTGSDGGDCYPNPMTHVEIINACTSAQAVDVNPVLPLLLPDGGLPPLP